MKTNMKRKVQAQRKFAQGAIVPHNERVETPVSNHQAEKKAENDVGVIFNKMAPSRLLDYVSFGTLKIRDVRVRVERLQETSKMHGSIANKNVQKTLKLKKILRKKKDIQRSVMNLRSRSNAVQEENVASNPPLSKRRASVAIATAKKKRVGTKPRQSPASAGSKSSDDDTPLFLINQTKPPKGNSSAKKDEYFLRRKSIHISEMDRQPVQGTHHDMITDADHTEITAQPSQTFYNKNEIERWIVDSADCVSDSNLNKIMPSQKTFKIPDIPTPRRSAPSPAGSQMMSLRYSDDLSDGGSRVASPSSPPEAPCPSVQFTTLESIQNASQKDLDHCREMKKLKLINHSIMNMVTVEDDPSSTVTKDVNYTARSESDLSDSIAPEVRIEKITADVYNFDEAESSIKERPILRRFREQKMTPVKENNESKKRNVYVELIQNNSSQGIRLKMPTGPQPLMKVSLVKRSQKRAKEIETQSAKPKISDDSGGQEPECIVKKKLMLDTGKETPTGTKTSSNNKVLEAPVLYPTESEFENPLAYIQKITPSVAKYGMCKIVPPKPLKPECHFEESARFEVTNQYIGRMFTRWGPATREFCAIRAHLATEKVEFTRPPLIDSMEVNMPKLYHIVQELGGLNNVLEKKRWNRVAEMMGWEAKQSLTKKLDQIYVKYLLPYDTLNNRERQAILSRVEKAWNKRYKKMLFRARNPLHKQRQLLGESSSSDDDDDDEEHGALGEADDCVVRGRAMNLATFKRIAINAMQLHFAGLGREPTLQEVLDKYWQLVLLGSEHVCVNAAAIDTGEQGYGFPKGKGDRYSKHAWNPKVLSNNSGSVLRSLGPVIGVTVPTLHLGMVFSTSCWHRDPHGLPWIEYMHEGPPKIWYGISEDQSDRLRAAVEILCPAFCQNKSIWLASDITMIPPNLLAEHNVTLSKVVQNPGEFVVIFPKAFSSSICSGFTISESVYYAPLSWLTTVQNDFQEVRDSCEPTMFPLEQLLLALASDARAPQSALPPSFRALDDIVRAELEHRRALHLMGYVGELSKATSRKKNALINMRETSECEICRSTLFLSKVVGIHGKSSAHCVQHARMLLQAARGPVRPDDLSVVYHYSEESLNEAVDRMRKRLLPNETETS